jgi:diguanylate cyclase (GGDEF)-like protein
MFVFTRGIEPVENIIAAYCGLAILLPMITINPLIYTHLFFALMVASIATYLAIAFQFRNRALKVSLSNYYIVYFASGLLSWTVLWFGSFNIIEFNLKLITVYYLLSGLLLFFSVAGARKDQKSFWYSILLQIPLWLLALTLTSDVQRLMLIQFFTIAQYSLISVVVYRKNRQQQNLGLAIIFFATALQVVGVPIQLVVNYVFDLNDLSISLAIFFPALGFFLVGAGYTTSVASVQQKQLIKLAEIDPLTGLCNRRGLENRLALSIARVTRTKEHISAIAIDIDFFKSINDQYGHPAGDQVLVMFSKIISKNARATDALSRLGGEEFIVVLPATGQDSALMIAERIRRDIEGATFEVAGISIKITASFGVASQSEVISLDELTQQADKALYKAKSTGRNRVCSARTE